MCRRHRDIGGIGALTDLARPPIRRAINGYRNRPDGSPIGFRLSASAFSRHHLNHA
jgi:hypothetical protein